MISRKRSIDSGTLRAFVYAGIAVGYAHGRDRESAYRGVLQQLVGLRFRRGG
jgi:hypothetical protein